MATYTSRFNNEYRVDDDGGCILIWCDNRKTYELYRGKNGSTARACANTLERTVKRLEKKSHSVVSFADLELLIELGLIDCDSTQKQIVSAKLKHLGY
jgi:hypothetical protein